MDAEELEAKPFLEGCLRQETLPDFDRTVLPPNRLKAHLAWLSMPYAEVLSDYERINQFCKYVPELLEYVSEWDGEEAWRKYD